jgi:DNA-binding response OmpR family regulator
MESKTIVVVDDEEDMASFFRHVLEDRGYRVLTANDGRQGIETVLASRPDLVLLDVILPVVQGQEACRYLKNQTGLGDMKIVMVSSLPAKDLEVVQSPEACADGYLHKPVGVRQVVDTVERLLA